MYVHFYIWIFNKPRVYYEVIILLSSIGKWNYYSYLMDSLFSIGF